jgi:hypothetical protein
MGKSILGVTVRNADGSNLSFPAALSRSLVVWIKGQGCNLPILNLIMHCTSYNQLTSFGVTSWDEEAKLKVRHEPLGVGRVMGAIAVVFVALGIGFAVVAHQAVERHRAERRAEARWQAQEQGQWADADDE